MAVKERFAFWQIILEELSRNRADRPFEYRGWLCGAVSPGPLSEVWERGVDGYFFPKKFAIFKSIEIVYHFLPNG